MNDAPEAMDGLRQVCHDVRQPAAGVLALAGAALAEAGLPENARVRLEQIADLAEWQSELIEHWLRATEPVRPDAGYADVARVVSEAMAAERATWPGELTFRWPPEPVFAPLHPVVLRRVVANLLANATRAAGPSGQVTVRVSCREGWMLIAVEDSGPGFGRIDGGSGLGLFTAAGQLIKHHGRLECGRGSLGGGQVRLWLPLPRAGTGRTMAHAASSV